MGPLGARPVSAGVVAATALSNLMIGRNTWLAVAFGFVNAGQALLATGLIERWFGRSLKLADVSQVLGFLVAVTIGSAVAALDSTNRCWPYRIHRVPFQRVASLVCLVSVGHSHGRAAANRNGRSCLQRTPAPRAA